MIPSIPLTLWQKKQAALLYLFSSMEYLKGLQSRVDGLRAFAEGTLDQCRREGRDDVLRSPQWGERNTGENWANNAWPFLADFQLSVTQDIAMRALQRYKITGANQCGRGIAEFSMQWTTPKEQQRFDEMFADLSQYAWYLDQTVDRTAQAGKWNDYGLTMAWQEHKNQFHALPKFRVLEDVSAESGTPVLRTGVYVAIDDPSASLQFAWAGSEAGRLLDCCTLNELGKNALFEVGRSKLWVDGQAMRDFAQANGSWADLVDDPFFAESQTAELAPTLVARNAFTSHPSRWHYIELMADEFEKIDVEDDSVPKANLRFHSGTVCPAAGTYFSPARPDSRRYFDKGDIFPDLRSEYGQTFWQQE